MQESWSSWVVSAYGACVAKRPESCSTPRRYAWREPPTAPQHARLHADIDSAAGFPGGLTQHRHELHALSVTIVHRQRSKAHPEDDVSLFPDGLDDGRGIGIPTVCQRYIPRPPRKMDETCAGRLSRDGNGDTLERDQVQTEVQAILGPLCPTIAGLSAGNSVCC